MHTLHSQPNIIFWVHFLETGSQVSTRDHYRSHQLSIWLSLIPRLTIASELEAKKSSNEKTEGDHDEEKDSDEEALDASSQFYLRHHLLADHENPDTYEGMVKQVQVSGLSRAHRRLMRTNLSAPLDWHQAMLYGRLNSLKGVTGRKLPVTRGGGATVRTAVDGTVLAAAEEVANNGKEQFAGRRAEEKAAGGLPAGEGLPGKGEDGPKKTAPEEGAVETSFDVVHFSPPGTDKILNYVSIGTHEQTSDSVE